MLAVEIISTPELGDRSYVAHDGKTALVVDPQRDIERVEALLEAAGLSCGMVAETHVHNDYLTGGFELARRHGCDYVLSAEDEVEFAHRTVTDGESLELGDLAVRVLSTPGHTYTHLCYVVDCGDSRPVVFTGGSLLYGSVGRTDLLGSQHAAELARLQYRSARRLAEALGDEAAIYPTHGFGSFCSAGTAEVVDRSTIAGERRHNPAFTVEDEDAFVARLLNSYGPYPSYYARMSPANRRGPRRADTSLSHIDPDTLRKRVAMGEWIVDLRTRLAYAHAHLAGTFSFPLERQLSTYLGWLAPPDSPLTLIADSDAAILAALSQLSRIGLGPYQGLSSPSLEQLADGEPLGSYPVGSFSDLAGIRDISIVDVRFADERREGHFAESFHLPFNEVFARSEELPVGRLAVHCGGGYRASVVSSILDGQGREVLFVNDDWENAKKARREIVAGA